MDEKSHLNLDNFQCIQCHACCRESGYVRLRADEPDAIAHFLGMDSHKFIDKYTRLTRDRQCLSLIEHPDGACIFLTDTGCRIQQVKPIQCTDFPHKWKFSGFEHICGWAKRTKASSPYIPRIPRPSSSSK